MTLSKTPATRVVTEGGIVIGDGLAGTGVLATYVREADFAVRPRWAVGPRTIQDYLLIQVQSGVFVATFGNEETIIAPGEICLIQPGVRHLIEGRGETITPYAHFDLFYDGENALTFPVRNLDDYPIAARRRSQPTLREVFGIEVPLRVRVQDPERFRVVMSRMIGTWREDDDLHRLETHYLMTDLIMQIVRAYRQEPTPPVSRGGREFDWLASYLSFHLSDPISVADMAARAGLSVSRFGARFVAAFGCSPHRYLRTMRVLHAQELLVHEDLTQDVIAQRCGFANAQHFSRVFRHDVGMAPGAYRRLHDGGRRRT